jgi:hypothetical protein
VERPVWLDRGARRRRSPHEAAALDPLVIDALEHRGEWITFDCRLTRTRAAIAAASAGHYREGEEVFRSALEAAEELDLRIEAADVRRLLAGMLLQRAGEGDAAEAGRLLDEASASYARMGMLRFRRARPLDAVDRR